MTNLRKMKREIVQRIYSDVVNYDSNGFHKRYISEALDPLFEIIREQRISIYKLEKENKSMKFLIKSFKV